MLLLPDSQLQASKPPSTCDSTYLRHSTSAAVLGVVSEVGGGGGGGDDDMSMIS
jgi:hypothetical protein